MEPIRPDNDELRADAPIGSAGTKKTAARKTRPAPKTKPVPETGAGKPVAPVRPAKGNGGGGSSVGLWLLLIIVAGAAGAGWYFQSQRIQAMEAQLEEADYWARQSKLALARFEGELSETGESLQQRGATMAEQIAGNAAALKTANSEIRKLWVVSNERNKARLNEHQERLDKVEKELAAETRALADLTTSVEQLKSSLGADLAALEEQTRTSIAALQDSSRQLTEQVSVLNQKLAEVAPLVDSRIRRFEQEQKLTINGMEGRISALEKETDGLAGDSQVRALQKEIATLKKTVASIDASRAQLTSRLVRLSDEVNSLRSGK